MSASTGVLRERAVHRGHRAHRGDPVVLDDPPEVAVQRGVAVAERSGPHHRLPLEQGSEQGDHEGVDVEQRKGGEDDGLGAEHRAGGQHPGVGDLVGVCVRGQFRGTGGAAGVEQRGQIGGARRDTDEGGRVLGGGEVGDVADAHAVDGRQWLGLPARRPGGPEHEDRVQPALAGERLRGVPRVRGEVGTSGDQHAGTGAAEEFGEVLPRQAAGQGGRDPGELRGQRRGDQLRAVR